jgi:hypothetical protein
LTRQSLFLSLRPHGQNYEEDTGCLKKNGPRYNFATDNPNEKKLYRKRNGSKNITNLSEHIIFIPSTDLWTMGNFYFSNGNLFFFIDSARFFF